MSTPIYKYNFVYQITNTINNKIYIGIHSTDNLNDGYMGSGTYLKRAQIKYGIENFTREILFYFDTYKEAQEKEREIVNEEFLKRDDVYNLTLGGHGSFYACNKFCENNKHLKAEFGRLGGIRSKELKVGINNPCYNKKRSEWAIKANNTARLKQVGIYNKQVNEYLRLLTLTPEAREKRINTFKKINHQQGAKNSQYGTMWVYNPILRENKKIRKDQEIPHDWHKGRITDWDLYFKKNPR